MNKPKWHGVIPAVVTNFSDDFSTNFEATLKHINFLINNGVSALVRQRA